MHLRIIEVLISECGCSLYNGVAALMAIHQKMSGILAGTKKDHINEVTVRWDSTVVLSLG